MNTTLSQKNRIQSIDILRGLIMLIMAIDHVRDFLHLGPDSNGALNMSSTYPALFFTRWITHFCAPIFVFLSGISAYLASTRRTKSEAGRFLIKRGVWLIVVEILVISLALSLNPLYNVIVLQVIWAIGFSMILIGLMIRLPLQVLLVTGLILVAGHDLLGFLVLPERSVGDILMKIFFTARAVFLPLGAGHFVLDLYAVLPWTGVMLLGFCLGTLFHAEYDVEKRRRFLLYSSGCVLLFFVLLRYSNVYGDPSPWAVQKNALFTFMSFVNVSKYPPSLLFCSMTIGVALLVLSFTENINGRLVRFFKVYGSVPFFYYVLHFYLIRIITIIVFFAQGFKTSQIITPNAIFLFDPPEMGFNLGITYLFWLGIILILYFPCKWFSAYKKIHHQWWLSYL